MGHVGSMVRLLATNEGALNRRKPVRADTDTVQKGGNFALRTIV